MGANEGDRTTAPIPGGIRPGESLWSVVHRFTWLNAISANMLCDYLGVPIGSPMNLLSGQWGRMTAAKAAKIPDFALRLLGLSGSQFYLAITPKFCDPGSFLR